MVAPTTAQLKPSPATSSIPSPSQFYTSVALTYGDLIYVSGWNAAAGVFTVTKADADVAGRPAQFVCVQQVAAAAVGAFAPLDQPLIGILDTSGGAVGDPVYLSATAGAMTLTAPTGAARVQIIGFVTVVSATVGRVQLVPSDAINDTVALGAFSGPLTVTSASASALAVGRLGAMTPALAVDASPATQVTGVIVTGRAAGAGASIAAQGGGAAEDLTIDAKGAGLITLNATGTGVVRTTRHFRTGLAGGATGAVEILGTTSGVVTVSVSAVAGTWTMTLPAAVAGMAGYQLTDPGADGVCTWAAAGSKRELKNILNEVTDHAEMLKKVLSTKVYNFNYKPGMGTGDTATKYVGPMADEAPDFMHYGGGIINPVNALGILIEAIKGLDARMTAAGV